MDCHVIHEIFLWKEKISLLTFRKMMKILPEKEI